MRRALTILSRILANVFVIVFGITLVASHLLLANSDAINSFFGFKTSDIVEREDGSGAEEDLEYFKSEFSSVEESKANAQEYTQKVVGEGAVLLKNDGVLPAKEGARTVNVYSISCVNYVTAGTGSSGTNTEKPLSLKDALTNSGFTVNGDLWDWYASNTGSYGRGAAGGGIGVTFKIKEAPWSVLPDAKNAKADLALFILSRNGGEGADLTVTGGSATDMTNGNYLSLSPQEKEVLLGIKSLKDSDMVGGIVVILNFANQVECDFIDDSAYGIDAALWIGDPGSTGIQAVTEILAGNINPSGRLTDTFWKRHYYNPVYANFGAYAFPSGGTSNFNRYVVYQEGIYNGYRYTETRYEDYILGKYGAGDFDYNAVVTYPFGYGISYAEFEYSNVKITPPLRGASKYTVTMTVTNKPTSTMAGKEVVEVYLQKPYTDYDIQNGIEKASVELVGFAKTGELAPGKSQPVTIEVDQSLFASYDANGAGTYILDKGDYYLTVATDAHNAINNILAAQGKTVADGMTENGNAAWAQKFSLDFDDKTYAVAATGQPIENHFADADVNYYEGATPTQLQYLSRSDWAGTVKFGIDENNRALNQQAVVNLTSAMKEDGAKPTVEKDDEPYPTYDADQKYTLVDLRADKAGNPIPYDSEMWDDLLDPLTWQETCDLLTHGLRMTYAAPSVGKFQTIDHNGATGPVQPYADNKESNRGLAVRNNDPDGNQYPTLYPCNGLVASTFDQGTADEMGVVEQMGIAMGNDCLWAGYNGIYGFGANLHRGAYCGRDFEYYSEDPFLTGKIAAAEVKGIQSKGTQVYMKHCVLNDMENSREGLCVFANEQTIRELYLRAFQIPIEEANAYNVMTSFTRIGVKWTGHQGFLNTVLRGEFGMKGIAITDWYQTGYMTIPGGIMMGSDLPDGTQANALNDYKEGYGKLAWAMRESVHRILYMHAQGNAMNGFSANMEVIPVTPAWVGIVKTLVTVTGVLAGVSALFAVGMVVANKVKKS